MGLKGPEKHIGLQYAQRLENVVIDWRRFLGAVCSTLTSKQAPASLNFEKKNAYKKACI